jgi:hypothetical protein
MAFWTERRHPVFDTTLELLPGQHHDLVLHLTEPVSSQPPVVAVQPLVRPQITRITADACTAPATPSH